MAIQWKTLMENAGSDFEPLPSGDYDVEVTKCEPKMSSTDKLMYKVQLKVLGGPHANRVLFHQFVVSPDSPNALSFFFQHMRALGLDSQFFAASPSEQSVADALLGKRARVSVGQKDWQGQTRNEVKKVAPLTGAVAAAAAPSVPAPSVPGAVAAAPTLAVPAPPAAPF
jgi:hypothetical protein